MYFALRSFTLIIVTFLFVLPAVAGETEAIARFESVRGDPVRLRGFLVDFPKGGDLHNHLDGAIYAENMIAWAAEDGKCVDLTRYFILPPPCDAANGRPPVRQVQFNADVVNPLIDALSTRNYERREASGHNQFFSTFRRFSAASRGREGDMLAEATARAANQNMLYLELLQSWGMTEAREFARTTGQIDLPRPIEELIDNSDFDGVVDEAIAMLDRAETRWREILQCSQDDADPGCGVTTRYLAQVIRVFPREEVLAQTLLAFRLVERDARFVGLNFVAPEDNPVALRDHTWQMEIIGELARRIPAGADGITLHAGELTMGLVPPEHLGRHIREAIEIAGARRIGHGIDVGYDPDAEGLLREMAQQQIMVEISLTSNADILGISGDRHPFDFYRSLSVPLALSTDDEGVSRIDMTHEYQRAVETYDVSYQDLKEFSTNSLRFSFLADDDKERLLAELENRFDAFEKKFD